MTVFIKRIFIEATGETIELPERVKLKYDNKTLIAFAKKVFENLNRKDLLKLKQFSEVL